MELPLTDFTLGRSWVEKTASVSRSISIEVDSKRIAELFPARSCGLLRNLFPLPGRHPRRPSLPAHAPQRHSGGILAVIRGNVLNLAGRDLGDHDGSADGIGGALLTLGASWHCWYAPAQR